MKCSNCGGSNPDYRRVCAYCGTFLERPPLDAEQEELRDQFLSMSLGVEDLSTLPFPWALIGTKQGKSQTKRVGSRCWSVCWPTRDG
jgi:hypothetical protein